MDIKQIARHLRAGVSTDHLIREGATTEHLMMAIQHNAQEDNCDKQKHIPPPTTQPDEHWANRKRWLLDGQPIHGTMQDFYYPALECLRRDDQVGYSRNRDMLFKAIRTWAGDPPPKIIDVEKVADL